MRKNCAQCSIAFLITEDDLKFYEKISPVFGGKKYLVPSPTLCPDCRLQRRLAFRNERKLYHRKCDLSGKQIISIYSPDKPFKVYASQEWWGDGWDPLSYGRDFDFTRPFFEQFYELMLVVPRIQLMSEQSENCDYTHNTTFSKNCYLCFSAFKNEDCYYNYMIVNSSDCVDNLSLQTCELCYECINCRDCYGGTFLQNCSNCTDCDFCFDCKGCKNCFGCFGLINKGNYLFNQPSTKTAIAEYKKSMQSQQFLVDQKKKFAEFKKQFAHRASYQVNSENCTGDHIYNSKNARSCFEVERCEDIQYCNHANNFKNSMDVYGAQMGGELQYENSAAGGGVQVMFNYLSWHNSASFYLNYCHNSSNLFGCIGLRHKRYCILNRQYSQEEYEKLVPRIIEHMQKTKEWGEFFPARISPYGYNETMADEFFPLTKKTILQHGWKWYEEEHEDKKYLGMPWALPDHLDAADEKVCEKIMACETNGKLYKITPQEFQFYKKMGVALPRFCPDCRHKRRIAMRNPRKIWERKCAKCGQAMMTSYAPERPETVYCESCYLKEVY